MPYLKFFVTEEEKRLIEELAIQAGLSVSALTRQKYNFETVGLFGQTLDEVIALAEEKVKALQDNEVFAVPDLFSVLDWRSLTQKDISAGQLGRRFFERVEAGHVKGVAHAGTKNRRTVYRKA